MIVYVQKLAYKGPPQDASPKPFSIGRGYDIKICSYCHKPCHTIDVYFKNQGLPPHLRKMNLTQTTPNGDTPYTFNSENHEESTHTRIFRSFTTEKAKGNF